MSSIPSLILLFVCFSLVLNVALARDAEVQRREKQRRKQKEQLKEEHSGNLRRNLAPDRELHKRKMMNRKNNKKYFKPTLEAGCFDWGYYIRDVDRGDYNRVRVSNGLWGRPIAYQGEPVPFADGSFGHPLHESADGGAVYSKDDGSGYYYASNSETGNAERGEFTGGVWVLETDYAHNVVDYYQVLSGTVDNCAGGRTPWGTWVSCEEEDGYGHCWQTDPANKAQTGPTKSEKTAVTPYPANWEAFAWDDQDYPPRGYVTDDAEPEDAPGAYGALVRFTPDEKAMECYHGKSKAEKWCTLNSGTHQYLKLNKYYGGCACGTIEWVDTPEEANSGDYRNGEGIDITDRILRFVAKKERLLFTIDLEKGTYCQSSTLEGPVQEPDNIRVLGDTLYVCTDGRTPNGVYGKDHYGYYALFQEVDYVTENAGLSFSEDGMVMYVAFQDAAIWQFWREDGYPFHAPAAKTCYFHDDGAVNDIGDVLEPLIEDVAGDVVEDVIEELDL